MSGTALKLLALFLMFIDHTAEFIPGMPIWFRWLGRISAPIFAFCMAWGFKYTHNRKIYVIRMYLFSVGIAVTNFVLNNLYRDKVYSYITNNIFSTLFLVAVIIWIIELCHDDKQKGYKVAFWFILWQVTSRIFLPPVSYMLHGLCPQLQGFVPLIGSIAGNIVTAEGGFTIVGLGVLLYFYKDTKARLIAAYGIFCIVFFISTLNYSISYNALFNQNFQWMMIFALPFMLLYNGQKGKGLKYFFYIFYPAHIIILFFIGNAMIR